MLIPIKKDMSLCTDGVEGAEFKPLGLKECHVEEFLRKNIGLVFRADEDDEDEDEDETLLIVGQQVRDEAGGRNDLTAVDDEGSIVLIEIKRDPADAANRHEPFESQAIRYAASLATIKNVDQLVDEVFARYVEKHAGEEGFDVGGLTYPEFAKSAWWGFSVTTTLWERLTKSSAFSWSPPISTIARFRRWRG